MNTTHIQHQLPEWFEGYGFTELYLKQVSYPAHNEVETYVNFSHPNEWPENPNTVAVFRVRRKRTVDQLISNALTSIL